MSLDQAWSDFDGSCTCGEVLENNCAHFLSNALISAGNTELNGGPGSLYRTVNNRVVCKSGRPVRAKELRDWAATTLNKAKSLSDGLYFCFQS